MTEQVVDETAEKVIVPMGQRPLVPDGVLLALLVLDGLLLGGFGLMFTVGDGAAVAGAARR
jgi:hypothetical protein